MISEASQLIMTAKKLKIYSHHDADGIASAAISVFVAKKLGLNYDVTIRNQLTESDLRGGDGVYWFNDLGSARANEMRNITGVITDHHNPSIMDTHIDMDGNNIYQFNPHLEGLDGSISQSGSTTTFLFSMNFLQEVVAASHIPVIGSVGDLHDKKYCRLVDADREVALLASNMKIIDIRQDIRYFGRSSKSISYMLRFGSDPRINAMYDNPAAVANFLESHGLERKKINSIRWIDLDEEQRAEILNSLKSLLEKEGGDPSRLVGEVYEITNEPSSSPIKDARDFSSLINATSRKGRPEVGIQLCLFQRGKVMEEALQLYSTHSESLRQASRLLDETEGREVGKVIYYDFGDSLENNITGTIATRIVTHRRLRGAHVVIVMANLDNNKKVSGRISNEFYEKIDLSLIMREAAKRVGGNGGGHRNAAGAVIPAGRVEEFINEVNGLLGA
jgi:single-stranded-DNA-specific exonuclease